MDDVRYLLLDADISACIGLKNIMPTIIIGKIDIVFPAIHMMKKFMGICFNGAKATSQDFWNYSKKKRICIVW